MFPLFGSKKTLWNKKRDAAASLLIFVTSIWYTYKLYEYVCEVIPCELTCWASALTI